MEIRAVLFDIDGTLLYTGGAGARAWQRAFAELYGVDAAIGEHTHAGMTDPEIVAIVFREVLGRPGSADEHERVMARYLAHLEEELAAADGYEVKPGIEETLPRLRERGVLLGLVTGNLEPAARMKLARGGLDRYFGFGGFGSDSRDRTELTRRAVERAAAAAADPLPPAAAIAVGDTPRDVAAGHGAGIRVVGVATGAYSVAQLSAAGADWALETVAHGFPI